MKIILNCFRDGLNPGDVADVEDAVGIAMINRGDAFPCDDADAEPDKAEAENAKSAAGRVVKGTASLEAATGTADGPA